MTAVPMTYNDATFDVEIELGLNLATGQVYAHFYSIDPNTQLPPDVLTGFLPPEDGTGRGEGYFSYIISPKAGLTTGTQIRNVAAITFDVGNTITTDQVNDDDPSLGVDPTKQALNTIDAGPPTSSVTALPATESAAVFTVSWSGQDDSGGSGIASYDVYVSDNGGAYTLWQQDTSDTTALFFGAVGHTYAFYSVAADNVGNVQPAPSGAEATTYVAGLPTSTVNPLPAMTTTTSFGVSWNGTPGAGASSIVSYEIFVSDNGGTFMPFLTSTTQTSATFAGQAGHRYSFYSLATNNLGLVQPAPTAGQATTQVTVPAPPPPLVTVTSVQDVVNKKHRVIQVIITFNGALNTAEADQVDTYRLATPGKKGSYTAKNAGIIKLKSAQYNGATEAVTLTAKKPFALTKPVQLLVYAAGKMALQDSLGRFINGGNNAVALLRRAGATVTAVAANPSNLRQDLVPSAVDIVLAREQVTIHQRRHRSISFNAKHWRTR